jgi:acyl-coenzyme A synthetase/AMP-(fatty) acid ligase
MTVSSDGAPAEQVGLARRTSSKEGSIDVPAAFVAKLLEAGRKDPTAMALVTRHQTLAYQELIDRADEFSGSLGSVPDRALLFDPADAVDTAVGLVGCMLAGRVPVFVPSDAPTGWLARLAAEVGATTRIGAGTLVERLWTKSPLVDAGAGAEIENDGSVARSDAAEPSEVDGTPIAYISTTSGSTGDPKPIRTSFGHLSVTTLRPLGPQHPVRGDRLGVIRSTTGLFVTTLLRTIAAGATLVPIDPKNDRANEIAELMKDAQVTKLRVPPSVLRRLLPALERVDALAGLQVLEASGERLDWADLERIRRHLPPSVVVVNGYGTSEVGLVAANVIRTSTVGQSGPVPVGRAVEGLVVRIDTDRGPDVPGANGELVILFDDARRATVPFERLPDGRGIIRTGDAATIDDEGVIHVHGRLDNVVKVAGARVDLAGIEEVLRRHPSVEAVAAIAVSIGGDNRIVAHAVVAETGAATEAALREYLAAHLPPVARPAVLRLSDEALPLLPSGKVDRRRLAELFAIPKSDVAAGS